MTRSTGGFAITLLLGGIVCLVGSPRFAPTSAASISASYTDVFTVTTSCPGGSTVKIDLILDFDGDGAVDTGEPVWQYYEVKDGGPQPPEGAIVVADTDGASNGSVTARFAFAGAPRPFGGHYIARATKGSTVERKSLTLDPPAAAQSVAGQVFLAGTSTSTPAVVFVTSAATGRDVVIVMTDAQGRFTAPVPAPGNYVVGGVVMNKAISQTFVPVNLGAGQTVTGLSVTIPQFPYRWQGHVRRSDTSGVIPFMHISAEREEPSFAGVIGITDANGAFDIPIDSGCYNISFPEDYIQQRGYAGADPSLGDCDLTVGSGNVSGTAYQLFPVKAYVIGRAEDAVTHADLAGATFRASVPGTDSSMGSVTSAANGRFAAGLPAGTWDLHANIDQESSLFGSWLALDGSETVTLTDGQILDVGNVPFLHSNSPINVQVVLYPDNQPLEGAYLYTHGFLDPAEETFRGSDFMTNPSGFATVPSRDAGKWWIGVDEWDIPAGYDSVPPHRTDVLANSGNRLTAYPSGFLYRPYSVYGGNQLPPSGGDENLYPQDFGYVNLGTVSGTATVRGTYRYFCIKADEGLVYVDAVEAEGAGMQVAAMTVNVADWGNVSGLDGNFATIGPAYGNSPSEGALYIDTGSLVSSITVYHPDPLSTQVVRAILRRTASFPLLDSNGDGSIDIADVVHARQ